MHGRTPLWVCAQKCTEQHRAIIRFLAAKVAGDAWANTALDSLYERRANADAAATARVVKASGGRLHAKQHNQDAVAWFAALG